MHFVQFHEQVFRRNLNASIHVNDQVSWQGCNPGWLRSCQRKQKQPLDSLNSDSSRRGEIGTEANPHMVYLHPLLDNLLSDEHLHHWTSHLHEPTHRVLHCPFRLFLLLSLHHNSPLHIPKRKGFCPFGTKTHPQPRNHKPPEDCSRTYFLSSCYGSFCSNREAQERNGCESEHSN